MPVAQAHAQLWAQDIAYMQHATTTVANSSALTAFVPNTNIVANFLAPGDKMRAQIFGSITTGSASGVTLTFATYWGGTGGTALYSTALSTVVSATTVPFMWETLIVCTAIGTLFAQGWFRTRGTLLASPSESPLPASAPAAVSGLTFSASETLTFAVKWSTTGSSLSASSNLFVLDTIGS